MSIDIDWARAELANFRELTKQRHQPPPPGVVSGGTYVYSGSPSDLAASAHVVEQILDRVLPRWRSDVPEPPARDRDRDRWAQHREAAVRADAALMRDAEVRQRLGDDAPSLSAGVMHSWAWDGARALWQSGHLREAVTAAAKMVNLETQKKVGRRDISEADLFKQAFTLDDPTPGKPRLRVVPNDGGQSFKNIHRGLMMFAEGCYVAIRNPNSHEANLPELPENEALEQLAAFSYLARQVAAATVVTAV